MASSVEAIFSETQDLRCPICLNVYTAPKLLPCRHTYCQHCLHKYIVKNVPEGKQIATFSCPECRKETFPPLPHIPVDKWAEHYPYNTMLLSVLPSEKREMVKSCHSCLYEGTSVTATSYCTVCKEVICLACEKMHRENKKTRDHAVVNIQDLITDLELDVSLLQSVTCSKHVGKEFELDTTIAKIDRKKKSGEGRKLPQTCLNSKPLKDCKPEISEQFNADYSHGKNPRYSGITCLPDDKIMLVDYENNTCGLYGSSYKHLAEYKLTSSPRGVCVVEGSQVAVTLPWENKIQLLTVDNSIRPERRINTSLSGDGIAALSRDQLVVSGTRNDGVYWCIVSMDGSEKSSVKVCPSTWYSCLAVNNPKTRIYVSYYSPGTVYAYNVNGTLIFKYEHQSLDGASGVAVDREDNLYVVSEFSHTIHQVSPDGTPLHVFSTKIPKDPCAICFTSSGDEFLLAISNVRKVQKFKLI